MNGVNNQLINPMIVQDLNTAELDNKSGRKTAKKWTEKENQQFIELKQKQPPLSFRDIATYFPGRTESQCRDHWRQTIRSWTEEENNLLNKLKQEQPALSWGDITHRFRATSAKQCEKHWKTLQSTFVQEGKQIENSTAKRLSQVWSVNKVDLDSQNDEAEKLPARESEMGRNSASVSEGDFNQIQTIFDTLVVVAQVEQMSPQNSEHDELILRRPKSAIKTKLPEAPIQYWTEEENERFIKLKQEQPELLWSDIAQHFPGRKKSCCRDHWRKVVQPKLLKKRKLEEENNDNHPSKRQRTEPSSPHEFPQISSSLQMSLKEKNYDLYQNLNDSFTQYKKDLNKYSGFLSLDYNKFMEKLFSGIESKLNLLKNNQKEENSREITLSLEGLLAQLQEIKGFFQSFFNYMHCKETESLIIARLKNEISLEVFYNKYAALIRASQKE